MNLVQTAIHGLDRFQRKHTWAGFVYAVVKKYGEDGAASQAALLTYYGFLALFPLLLIMTTVTDRVITDNPHLRDTVIHSVTDYFPLLGNQLADHVHALHKNGLALVVGVLFTFYGARGVAEAFRKSVQRIWRVPTAERDTFPKSLFKSLLMLLVGGLGFIIAAVLASLTAAAGQGMVFRVISVLLNMFILFWLFYFLIELSLPSHLPFKQTRVGAAAAAVGLVVLQSLGGYLLAHELRNLDALYSYFALALGLIFWIYLQAHTLCYSMQIAYVHSRRLWPRAIDSSSPTEVDKRLAANHSAGGR